MRRQMVTTMYNNNGNRNEWSPIRSVIIRVINKIERPRSGGSICLITSMITHQIGRHEVLLPINHNHYNFQFFKVSRWLIRYLKSKDDKLLCRFLRFCTGSDVVLPDRRIKVQMVYMSSSVMWPKAQTCFNILTFPGLWRTWLRTLISTCAILICGS